MGDKLLSSAEREEGRATRASTLRAECVDQLSFGLERQNFTPDVVVGFSRLRRDIAF